MDINGNAADTKYKRIGRFDMADVFTRKGFDGSGWNIDLGDSDFLAPMGVNFGNGISVAGFQSSTHKTDSGMTTDGCDPDHVRNCKYIAPTQVSLMEGAAVDLKPDECRRKRLHAEMELCR